ncbi:MAG: tetratricopeptide repeat protein [Acidobacteria bacterium]|nr:tetratricopeptide repeat protein [Acidobacteriota bacterium]
MAKKTTPPKKEPAASDKAKYTEFKSAQPSKVEITAVKAKPNLVAAPTNSDDRFEDLIESGNEARDDRNYSAAETSYKAARTLKPKDSRATYGLGNLYSDQQRWEEAENAYRSAIQLDPNNATSYVALSYVLTQPIAAPNLSERYEEAEKLAQKAIQLAPSNALAFDQFGVAQELRGLIGAETENAYRTAIKLRPSFAPAYAHLGRLLRRRGLTKESAAAYDDAVKRSNDVATMILVAEVMQSEQRYSESEKLLQSALNGDPRNPSAMLLLGRALTAQGKYDDAERVLRANLNISPNGFTANSLLGTLYTRQGKFEMAESSLTEALKTVSALEKRGLSQQFEAVGDGFIKAGNRQAAERSYRQAIALDNENQGLVSKLVKAQRG